MARGRKPKVAKLDAASTVVDNTTLSETTNAGHVVGSPVTRASKRKAAKNLPESSNPGGGDAIMEKVSVEVSEKEQQFVENLGSEPSTDHLSIVEKIDFLVQSVQEFKSKGIKQQIVNEDKALEFNYKSQYLKYQKMVEALTKENHDLSVKLESALAKLEVYEKMNALGQMKEMMNTSNVTKATEVLVNFSSQLTKGKGGALPAIASAAAAEPNAPLLQTATGEGINPAVAAEQTASLPQATTSTGQGTTSTVSAEPELGRSKRSIKKKFSHGRLLPKDRISSLPDDVLLHILPFLTLKEVLMTNLLSRRWLNLWVNTVVLDFDVPVLIANEGERQKYIDWVNSILGRHTGPHLQKFKVVFDLNNQYKGDIDGWLVFVLGRKVQSLELNFLLQGQYVHHMGENYTLSDGGDGRLSQFDFKCLTSLSLKNVDVTSDDVTFFLKNCPFLERLEVVGTLKLGNLVISDPSLVLKYLMIKWCYNVEYLSISNFNLVSLDIPALDHLILTHLPKLVELSITGAPLLSNCFRQASSSCSQLEALTLDTIELKELSNLLSNDCRLTKLKRLVIQVGAFGDKSLTRLISIISYFPHLEEFVLKLDWLEPKRSGRTIPRVGRHRSCLENKSLKVFEFKGYYGRGSDVELIMHVVEYSDVLEKIIIDPHNVRPPFGTSTHRDNWVKKQEDAISIASEQFEGLRGAIPPHVTLVRCGF